MVVIADCHKIKFYIHRMLLHYCLSGPLYDSFENTSVHCVTTFIALQYYLLQAPILHQQPSLHHPAHSSQIRCICFLKCSKTLQKLPSFFFIAYCIIFKGEKSTEQNEKQTKRIYLFLYSKTLGVKGAWAKGA